MKRKKRSMTSGANRASAGDVEGEAVAQEGSNGSSKLGRRGRQGKGQSKKNKVVEDGQGQSEGAHDRSGRPSGGRSRGSGRGFADGGRGRGSGHRGRGWGGSSGGSGRGFSGGARGSASARSAKWQNPQRKQQESHSQDKQKQPQQGPRRPLADLLDYLRSCAKTLDGGLGSDEAEEMMASRALEEMGDRILLVAADQRGSKPLERLLRRAGSEAFGNAFKQLMEAFVDLAPNQYASHVLEASFASWAERLGAEPERRAPAAPLVAICEALGAEGSWAALIENSCASHAVRALILALGGFSPDTQGKGKVAARAGLLPERRWDVPPEVVACRRAAATALLGLLREDTGMSLNASASPVVQLLFRVLKDRGDYALLAQAQAAVVGAAAGAAPGPPSAARCDALVASAPGSRALEAVVETGSAELVAALFSGYFRKRLGALASGKSGEFGPFLVQRIADGLREEPQLQSALAEVDFDTCLSTDALPSQHAVVVKLLEACLRLRACFKPCATAVFRALGLRASAEYHRAWPTLLALQSLEAAGELLRPSRADSSIMALRPLPSAGPQILGTLLRFPTEAVQPLNSGVAKFVENREVLGALAREAKTARVLEAALAPSSALGSSLRLRLARAFKGLVGDLGPHSVGGWVCAALWRASLGDASLRQTFKDELLAAEEALRAHNFAVWKVCGLHQAKTREEEWSRQQHKAGKAKRLFDELLEGGDPEAIKAAAAARQRTAEDAERRRAAVLADPTVAALLPAAEEEEEASPKDTAVGDEAQGDAGLEEAMGVGKRGRGKKRKVSAAVAAKALSTHGALASAATSIAASGDDSLTEALQLITGKASARLRKRKKKQREASAGSDD